MMGMRNLIYHGGEDMADARFPLEDYFGFDVRPYSALVRFEAGDIILSEGEANDALFFLEKGRVKVSATQPNGKVLIVSFIDAPAFLGELEFLGARELTNGVTAVLPCACWRIDGTRCRERILNDATFLRKLCVMQGRRFVQNAEKSAQSQSYPLKARLAQFILQTAPDGVYREKHTEAAAYLGVTYRHYLYVLADMVDRGILEKTPQGYHIRDREDLRSLSGMEML